MPVQPALYQSSGRSQQETMVEYFQKCKLLCSPHGSFEWLACNTRHLWHLSKRSCGVHKHIAQLHVACVLSGYCSLSHNMQEQVCTSVLPIAAENPVRPELAHTLHQYCMPGPAAPCRQLISGQYQHWNTACRR